MSYLRKIEYKIIPEESFKIIRNCPGCGHKQTFHNTNCFRVNANGNKIDVWLIYQCTTCKHTYNLTVYERCNPESIIEEYQEYLGNSKELAFRYGTDSQFFAKNKAEINWSNIKYHIMAENYFLDESNQNFSIGDLLVINNSYSLKLRKDKVVSEVLNLTRAQVKRLEKVGIIVVTEEKLEHKIIIEIKGEINID